MKNHDHKRWMRDTAIRYLNAVFPYYVPSEEVIAGLVAELEAMWTAGREYERGHRAE